MGTTHVVVANPPNGRITLKCDLPPKLKPSLFQLLAKIRVFNDGDCEPTS